MLPYNFSLRNPPKTRGLSHYLSCIYLVLQPRFGVTRAKTFLSCSIRARDTAGGVIYSILLLMLFLFDMATLVGPGLLTGFIIIQLPVQKITAFC